MTNKFKLVIFLVCCFTIIFLTKNIGNNFNKNTLEVAGIRVDRAPYLQLVTQMFEKSVDSNRTCDCLIKSYYEIIKLDSIKLAIFLKTKEFIVDSENSNLIHASFNNCVLENICDSTYRMKFTGIFRQAFFRNLRSEMKLYPEFEGFDADVVATCIASKLDGNVTIKEFYKEANLTTNKYRSIFRDCIFEEKARLESIK